MVNLYFHFIIEERARERVYYHQQHKTNQEEIIKQLKYDFLRCFYICKWKNKILRKEKEPIILEIITNT